VAKPIYKVTQIPWPCDPTVIESTLNGIIEAEGEIDWIFSRSSIKPTSDGSYNHVVIVWHLI